MKKLLTILLVLVLALSVFVLPASAIEIQKDTDIITQVEYLDNGNYIVTEIEETTSIVTRATSTKSGSKTSIYYTSAGTAIWSLKVSGTFTYNGSTSTATSASHLISFYVTGCTASNYGSYTSGSSAYAYTTVKYLGNYTDKTTKLTCSASGVLS